MTSNLTADFELDFAYFKSYVAYFESYFASTMSSIEVAST